MRSLAVLGLLVLGGCIAVHFDRARGFEPVDDEVLLDLREQGADLATCLQRLGAPTLVHELPDGGIALAWGWLDEFGWGIQASINLRGVEVSGDFDGLTRDLEGAVLFFDGALRLVKLERGLLHDFLRAPDRRRPAAVDDRG